MWGQSRWPWHRTPFVVAPPALIGGMTHRILFVCLGNICRSPTAEAVTRAKAEARGLPLVLDSAGTGDWHIGKPPYAPMQGVARAAGYDLSMLRARQVARPDFQEFDLIIAMDEDNAATLAKWGHRIGSGNSPSLPPAVMPCQCPIPISPAISKGHWR